jgi:hypothetical protein
MGAALLTGKIHAPWARRSVGGVLLLAMTAANVHYIRELDLPSNPSYRGAVAYVESRRSPGEPVIVCDHVAYLPMLYYVQKGDRDNDGWYMFGSHPDPDFNAWVAMDADNVVDPEELAEITGGRVWVVETAPMHFYFSSDESTCDVSVPANWTIRNMETFDDLYGVKRTLKVLEYEVVPPAEVKN